MKLPTVYKVMRTPRRSVPPTRAGVALLITLIMLSIITFIAVTFLLLARRERAQVTQAGSLTLAETAAATARERALAEILARIAGSNDLLTLPALVSTNVDIVGPVGGYPSLQITNDPRAPVFLPNLAGLLEDRFYLDLNRNRRYDPTVPEALGDPEWIGVLEYADAGHSGTNQFRYRFAYMVLPVGGMLDVNTIHNSVKRQPLPNEQAFVRNQGMGPWELNLAALFSSLHTNAYGNAYNYWPATTWSDLSSPRSYGDAFADAERIVGFRNFLGQQSAEDIFSNASLFASDRIDNYSDGPLHVYIATNSFPNLDNVLPDDPSSRWPGAPAPNPIYTPWELLNTSKYPNLANNLTTRSPAMASSTNAYDTHLFYRLLSQLGTDTAPLKLTNYIHLNYDNVTTNLESLTEWDATTFFNLVADRLIRARSNEFGFTITNILIWEPTGQTNLYSQELHQLLQMTANIYDATRNDAGIFPDYPTVFRPLFRKGDNGEIYIDTYQELTDLSIINQPILDLLFDSSSHKNISTVKTNNVMVWGVPLIIGARKGYPNFNEFALQTYIQVTRKLEFRRPSTNSLPNQTNQMFILGISNIVAAEFWNPYTTNTYPNGFPRNLQIFGTNIMLIYLTNEFGYCSIAGKTNPVQLFLQVPQLPSIGDIPQGSWDSWNPADRRNLRNFRVPLYSSFTYLPDSAFFVASNLFVKVTPNPGFDRTPGFHNPRWILTIRNYAFFAIIDNGRIVDYVNISGLDQKIDIYRELLANNDLFSEPSAIASMWLTNRIGGNTVLAPTEGIYNQIEVCLGNRTVSAGDWRSYSDQAAQGLDKEKSIDTFRVFMGYAPLRYQRSQLPMSGLVQQSPFSPTRKICITKSWQVNDPLVHYHLDDLRVTNVTRILRSSFQLDTNWNIGKLNDFYEPWGGRPNYWQDPAMVRRGEFDFNLTVKDPEVRSSDDWDFPHTKFANVGWLGRVHRGTPWQTIYLKSPAADDQTWRRWSGSRMPHVSHPTNDWRLVDLFTVAPHPEATRGLMPINQTNYAAWAAALSGILVVTPTNNTLMDVDIKPNSPELDQIYQGIMNFRATLPRGRFERVSDLLQVPELTVNLPYLNASQQQPNAGPNQRSPLSDYAYEILPFKLMSLLRVDDPRFVIYAWGQSLRPANGSLQMTVAPNHPAYMLCTNYVVTGEVGTRTVVRIEDAAPNAGTVRPRVIIESFNFLPPE